MRNYFLKNDINESVSHLINHFTTCNQLNYKSKGYLFLSINLTLVPNSDLSLNIWFKSTYYPK